MLLGAATQLKVQLSSSRRAVVTESHRPRGSSNRSFLSQGSGGWGLVWILGEGPLPGLQTPASWACRPLPPGCMLPWRERELALHVAHKDTNPITGPHLSHHCCSVTKSHPTLCSPTDCNMPGFPVLHCLPEFLKLLSIELAMPSHHLLLCPLVTSSKSHQFTKALPLHTTTLGVRASDTSLGKAQFSPQH